MALLLGCPWTEQPGGFSLCTKVACSDQSVTLRLCWRAAVPGLASSPGVCTLEKHRFSALSPVPL